MPHKDINVYDNLNEMVFDTCDHVIRDGEVVTSRNGSSREICDYNAILTNPRNRHLYLHGRKSNIFATIGETLWVMAGVDTLDPLMKFLIPRSVDFSDDGGSTWRAAYGARLWANGQIDHVVRSLWDDLNSRQAVMTIWDPSKDTLESMKGEKTKDRPCSNWLGFQVRNNKLNLKLQMRSNDVIWGLSHINVFEFTFLQEIICEMIRLKHPLIGLGSYTHAALSMHVYDPGTITQAVDIVKSKENRDFLFTTPSRNMKLGSIDPDTVQSFFHELYDSMCHLIDPGYDIFPRRELLDIFMQFKVPIEDNQLFDYCRVLEYFILEKKGIWIPLKSIMSLWLSLSEDLKIAVSHNGFTPKRWLEAIGGHIKEK